MTVKTKRFIRILLINAVLIGFGILILELIFGDWVNKNNLNKLNIIRDRTIEYQTKPYYSSPLKTATYTRDKFGLRGPNSNPSDIDILTVGGSTTDQRYITDGQTWQDVLQKELATAGHDIVVANAGVDGQSTFGHLDNFEHWFPNIPNLSPKYILFYIGLNDFHKNEGYGKDALVANKDDKSFRQLLREKSAIYHIARILYGVYQAELGHNISHRSVNFEAEQWVSEPLTSSYDAIMNIRMREYSERLDALIQRTISFGSIPIFVTQPSRKYMFSSGQIVGVKNTSNYDGVPINGMDYYFMIRKLDHITCSQAKTNNILCIDLAKEMIREWEHDDFYDYAHMTPKGAEKIGQYLSMILQDHL